MAIFMAGFYGKKWGCLKVNFMALLFPWMLCFGLCNGSDKNWNSGENQVLKTNCWSNWYLLTIENFENLENSKECKRWKNLKNKLDLQDLENGLLLIATGKIWDCPLPLEDDQRGITEGKMIKEILEMLNGEYSLAACHGDYEKLQDRKYCLHRLKFLRSLTFGENFIKFHGNDVTGLDGELLKFLMERIVLRLCPSLVELKTEWNLLPRWMLLEVVDLSSHIKNMIENKALKVHHNRQTKEREFRIDLCKMGVIYPAFQDLCEGKNCQFDFPRIKDKDDPVLTHLHIHIASRFFFRRVNEGDTLLKTIFVHE
ncbi:MAG: hypothetical protein LBI77_03970 [Puniceicoccales bacterium]|jgi:hypothetical protein|nr:hypothetical protein [Puniceicoccales bacterium]